jgi:lipopolysaccharide transport system ATP-binding protein
MGTAILAEGVSKEYRLGVINHGMLYKDIQTWLARRIGKADPHARIGKEYHSGQPDRFWALRDLNFRIEQGDRVGLIGRNGAGKSTLLKILSRITAPTEGRIGIKGRVASLLEVGTGFHPELTGRENVFLNGAILGMKRCEVARKFDEIVTFSEIEKFIDTPVKRYSSGMYVRLAFAVAAHLDSDILLADEVLAVGDTAFQKKCLGKMEDVSRNEGRTVVFVSHNMSSIKQLCINGLLLFEGSIKENADIKTVITSYLDTNINNELILNNQYLKRICVSQDGASIIFKAEYTPRDQIPVPYLSLNLIDMYGNTIYTANARNYDVVRSESLELNTIEGRIVSPLLHNGTYTVSLFYGSIGQDYIALENCLKLDIKDMVLLKRPVNTTRSGFVHPIAEYRFS